MIDDADDDAPAPERRRRGRERPAQKRSTRVEVNGWINLDKPVGVTSTQAVGRLKFLFNAKKAGHAGTLDPLASGVLPVAFGEATKTVPIVQDGAKAYRFRVRWGEESATDDAEGEIVARSDTRPRPAEIEAALPRFVGLIEQTPPTFPRSRSTARAPTTSPATARPSRSPPGRSTSTGSRSSRPTRDTAVLEAECGKGAYVRAIARDLGRALGCYGHVIELRRTRVGPFSAETGVPLDRLPDDAELMARAMLPLEAGLSELPALPVDRNGAAILRRGQALLVRGATRPKGPPGPPASARRSRSARSRAAISSRRACST